MNDFLPLPAAMVHRAREFRGPAAVPRPAATVVLLRPANPTFEAYVLRRRTTMVFGGVYAFPGGGVAAADRDGPEPDGGWAERLGVSGAEADAVVRAAVREVQEETTVRLLAETLLPWARWITPEFEPRRFDTWFFVTALPLGEQARDISGEADLTAWLTPVDAMTRYAAGELTMLPPTVAVLRDLAAYRTIEEVVAAAAGRDAARPVMPSIELTADGRALLRLP